MPDSQWSTIGRIERLATAPVKRIFLHKNEPKVIDNKVDHKKRTQFQCSNLI